MRTSIASPRLRGLAVALVAGVGVLLLMMPAQALAKKSARHVKAHRRAAVIHKYGELDCNGFSHRQRPVKITMPCTDLRGLSGVDNAWTWGGRFYDNGHYIGHDEPDMTFLSNARASGNDVSWTQTLPMDPSAAPTATRPGSDVTHWFELSPAPWFSMAMCDSNSYPLLPCEAKSDLNAPACAGLTCSPHAYPGAGSAFMEMQFYPPGFSPPWTDGISCDNTHWCGALTIDSLECTINFASCNPNCTEPVNFGFVQRDGRPTGPPNPQDADVSTFTPNGETLLMNPGDQLSVHMFDAAVPGEASQHAFEVVVRDLTTGQTGYMQASAKNGFQNTSIVDCSGTRHNFEPEYNTAARPNIVPWAALQTDISTEYEIGHFEPCTSITDPRPFPLPGGGTDTVWLRCHGPYEDTTSADSNNAEVNDAPCYPAGYTHGFQKTPPDTTTGCLDFTSGDLDFEGSSYWADWPTSTSPTATFPGSFVQALPLSTGRQYSQFFMQTDSALSESTCPATGGAGCAIPPPNAPGAFYPYWDRVGTGTSCMIEFGNVSTVPGSHTYGKDAQYGTNQVATYGYPEFIGPTRSNNCSG